MQQVWITKRGGPEVFELREAPAPSPAADEVLIDVEAMGINFADLLMRRGVYASAPDLPAVPGYEAAGTVRAVGADVDGFTEGDAVLALTNFGGYATQVAVPARQVWRRPEGMSAEEGAALPVNYLTAFEAMVVMGSLRRPDELGGQQTRVLVHGGAGGVGTAAAQVGQLYDAKLIGTASAWKHDFARQQGYDHLINYREEDFVAAVQDLTDGRGVDLVLDPIGGRHWKRSLDTLAPMGRLCVFGMADAVSGPWSALKMLMQVPWWRFTPPYLLTHSVGVFGYFLGAATRLTDETRDWFEVLLRHYDEGAIQPHIHNTFPLAQAGEAHAYVEARKSVGKVLLKP